MQGENDNRLRNLCCFEDFLHELNEVRRDGELERCSDRTRVRNEMVAASCGRIGGEPEIADHLASLFGKIESRLVRVQEPIREDGIRGI
jgi:hypothetical protein